MKKLLGIIVLGLLLGGNAYADPLGIGEKKLDINFDCKINKDSMLKEGYPIEFIENWDLKFKPPKFGYKEYDHPDEGFMLIHLDNINGKYSFPDSISIKSKSNVNKEYMYTSFNFAPGYLSEYQNHHLLDGTFYLLYTLYKVDLKNSNHFDKKLDKLNTLPNDDFVKSLLSLTKDFQDYTKQNKDMRSSRTPYRCEAAWFKTFRKSKNFFN